MKEKNTRLTVALTGGEPFLKEEIWRLVDYLYSSSFVANVSVITNGTIIDKHLTDILEHPLLTDIYVSLDGLKEETNDSIRGKGVFSKTVENIKILKSHHLSVFIMYTLLKKNIEEAKDLSAFCKSLSLDGFILERFIPLGQGAGIKQQLIEPEELKKLYKTIFDQYGAEYNKRLGAKFHALKVDSNSLYGAECVVGKDGCAILPDGSVLPCRRFDHPIGNLLEESLSDIFTNAEVLNKLRDRTTLKGDCRDCEVEGCQGCRALAHAVTGDYLSFDPLCRLVLQK